MTLAEISGLEYVTQFGKSVLALSKLKIRNTDVIRVLRPGV